MCTILPASNTSTGSNNGWLGGLNSISVKLTGNDCIKIPSNKLGNAANTYIKFTWGIGSNNQFCSLGSVGNIAPTLEYYTTSACTGSYQSVVSNAGDTFWSLPNPNECINDRGDGGNYQYYRVTCDVPEQTKTISSVISESRTIVNNITTYVVNNISVPTIVRPADLIPLIQSLMITNASLFRPFAIASLEVPANASSPSPPPLVAAPNTATKSDGNTLDVGLLGLLVVSALVFFFA